MDTKTVIEQLAVKEPEQDRLSRLGFKHLGTTLEKAKAAKRKLAIAYEHFRFVAQEKVNAFNERLRRETQIGRGFGMSYAELAFVPIENYDKVPPKEALDALEVAQGLKCFDTYEVGYIRQVKDPLLFGRVTGCPDRFFIAQWDDDVSISDLLKANEG